MSNVVKVYGYKTEMRPWLERERLEHETLDKVFAGIKLEGLKVLDAGTGIGYAAKYLAQRIGEGVLVTIDIDASSLEMLKRLAGKELTEKLVFIKADLRNLDFIKDNYFDLACLYYTIHTINSTTPCGVRQVLKEIRRVLRPSGLLIAVENYATFEPIDDAQQLLLELARVENEINTLISRREIDVEYDPKELCTLLVEVGYRNPAYRKIDNGSIDPTLLTWALYLKDRARGIPDQDAREKVLAKLRTLIKKAEKTGIRSSPTYAVYAKK
ncbi:MAG: hypothetical protein B6U95_02350 [Thermofilum sp. ex4484_82]|nr:MAG: hypothetical protein B6U95_02350 [Thermofilum sp. ex4484_82]OYT39349.1 MAG: hypothetical protein B6U96_02350 [Archaeoglobales archaeon ex4484_92]